MGQKLTTFCFQFLCDCGFLLKMWVTGSAWMSRKFLKNVLECPFYIYSWVFFRLSYRNCLSCILTGRMFPLSKVLCLRKQHISNEGTSLNLNHRFSNLPAVPFERRGVMSVMPKYNDKIWISE